MLTPEPPTFTLGQPRLVIVNGPEAPTQDTE